MEDGISYIVTANKADYEIRYEELNGKRHMVVPVVMIREGVHSGNLGPIYYPPDSIANMHPAWNGVPITINHTFDANGESTSANSPEFAEQSVGTIYNTKFDSENSILSAEAWIEEDRVKEISPAAFNALMARKPLDVSTGAIPAIRNEEGEWQGEEYKMVLDAWVPDHLALLPGMKGACSWEDGCGIMANEEAIEDESMEVAKYKDGKRFTHQVVVNFGFKSLVNIIASRLNAMDNAERYHMLEDVYKTYFIYRLSGPNVPVQYFKREYDYKKDTQTLEFIGSPKQVKKKIDFVVVNTDSGGQEQMSKECKCSEDKVISLIAASDTFTDEDKETLMTLSEEKVDKLLANAKVDKGGDVKEDKEVKEEKKETTLEEAMQVVANQVKPDQLLKLLPTDVQEHIQIGLDSHKERHAQLINEIKEMQEEFTEEELTGMSVPQLERFAKAIGSAKPKTADVDYSVLGVGILSSQGNGKVDGDVPILPIANAKGGDA